MQLAVVSREVCRLYPVYRIYLPTDRETGSYAKRTILPQGDRVRVVCRLGLRGPRARREALFMLLVGTHPTPAARRFRLWLSDIAIAARPLPNRSLSAHTHEHCVTHTLYTRANGLSFECSAASTATAHAAASAAAYVKAKTFSLVSQRVPKLWLGKPSFSRCILLTLRGSE